MGEFLGQDIDTKQNQNVRLEDYVEWRNENPHTNIYNFINIELPLRSEYEDSPHAIDILWVNETSKFD